MIITNRNNQSPNYQLLHSLFLRQTLRTPIGLGIRNSEDVVVAKYNQEMGIDMDDGTVIVVAPFNQAIPMTKYKLIGVANINGTNYGAWLGATVEGELGESVLLSSRENLWENFRTHLEGGAVEPPVVEQIETVKSVTMGTPLSSIEEELSSRVYENLVESGVSTVEEMVTTLQAIINGEQQVKYVGEKTAQSLLETYGNDTYISH